MMAERQQNGAVGGRGGCMGGLHCGGVTSVAISWYIMAGELAFGQSHVHSKLETLGKAPAAHAHAVGLFG